MTIKLKKGVAIIIGGKQGCGKTTLAIETAKKHGSYAHINFSDMMGFGLREVLCSEPDTIIVEEFKPSRKNLLLVKDLVMSNCLLAEEKYSAPRKVKTPNFIFCTSNESPLKLSAMSRRFMAVNL